jgi:hypothetical protein
VEKWSQRFYFSRSIGCTLWHLQKFLKYILDSLPPSFFFILLPHFLDVPVSQEGPWRPTQVSILKDILSDASFSSISRVCFSGTYYMLFIDSLEKVLGSGDILGVALGLSSGPQACWVGIPITWATLTMLFGVGFFFWDRVSWTICLALASHGMHLISASWVARMTHMSHQWQAHGDFWGNEVWASCINAPLDRACGNELNLYFTIAFWYEDSTWRPSLSAGALSWNF